MIAVAHHFVGPLREEVANGLFVVDVQTPACLLGPSDVAQLVGPVEVSLLEDLLVETRAVEAHGLAHLDVVTQGLVAGSRPDTVGIEALVEDETLEVRLIIQVEVAAGQVYLAHSGIGLHLIQHVAFGVANRVDDVIEVGRFRTPQLGILDGQHDDGVVGSRSLFARHEFLLLVEHLNGQHIAVAFLIELGTDDELLLVDVGRSEDLLQSHRVDGFHPDRLPDARNTRIVATCAVEAGALLAAGLLAATQIVLHLNDEVSAATSLHELRDVEGERRTRAAMATDLLSVDEDDCVVIDGTKVEQNVLACPSSRNIDVALVPDAGDEVGVLHAGEFAFRAEGDGYLAVEALAVAEVSLRTSLSEVKTIAPSTVQVDPIGTFELWTWVLAARKVCCLNCARQSEQQGCCHKQLAEVFHFFCLYYII